MAYREVRVVDYQEVVRRWLAGDGIRSVARGTGLDRKTVRRIHRAAERLGLNPGDPVPDDNTVAALIGRTPSESWRWLSRLCRSARRRCAPGNEHEGGPGSNAFDSGPPPRGKKRIVEPDDRALLFGFSAGTPDRPAVGLKLGRALRLATDSGGGG